MFVFAYLKMLMVLKILMIVRIIQECVLLKLQRHLKVLQVYTLL